MSHARVPSSGLRGGGDDEGDGVAIGVNELIIGCKWEPVGGLSFKQYASARVADKFAEEGGALTFYARESDGKRFVFRCTTIPAKSVRSKMQKVSKEQDLGHNKLSMKDDSTCKFVVRFVPQQDV
jgi:hypothetical protein